MTKNEVIMRLEVALQYCLINDRVNISKDMTMLIVNYLKEDAYYFNLEDVQFIRPVTIEKFRRYGESINRKRGQS